MATNDTILEINNISVCFDGFYALTDVRTKVKRNTIHFFIGPNGAGKTTLLDIICAKTKPTAGTVIYYPKGKARTRRFARSFARWTRFFAPASRGTQFQRTQVQAVFLT